jgi:hypothetical protein
MRNMLSIKDRLKPIPFPDLTLNVVDNPLEVIFKVDKKIYMTDDATNVKIAVWDVDK